MDLYYTVSVSLNFVSKKGSLLSVGTFSNEIEQFIYTVCYSPMWEAAYTYIAEHPYALNLSYSRIQNPDSAMLEDMILEYAKNIRIDEDSTINKILRNEKYIGDALLQKTYTTDFLNKTRVKNNGIVPQYYVEGNHEAIIPKDIFLRVQEELVRRRVVKTSANGKKRSYSCNHCFAQIVICGECGEMFRRIHWNNRGCKSIVWRCISRLEPTGQECHARTVNEPVLENVVVQSINTLLGDKSTY